MMRTVKRRLSFGDTVPCGQNSGTSSASSVNSTVDAEYITMPDALLCEEALEDCVDAVLSEEIAHAEAIAALRSMEADRPGPGDYIFARAAGSKISAAARATLVNYMTSVAVRLRISDDALFAGVDIYDRFLAACPELEEEDRLVRSAASACLCIAAKLLSRHAGLLPSAAFAPDMTDVDGRAVQEAEMTVLQALDFRVSHIVTSHDVLQQLSKRLLLPFDYDVACMASYLAQLALLDAACLRFTPSIVAAACLECALSIMRPGEDATTVAATAARLSACCHGLPPGHEAQRTVAAKLMLTLASKARQAAAAGNPYMASVKLVRSTGLLLRP